MTQYLTISKGQKTLMAMACLTLPISILTTMAFWMSLRMRRKILFLTWIQMAYPTSEIWTQITMASMILLKSMDLMLTSMV